MHYVIIGGSAAGISAAETLRLADSGAEITIISREPDVAYSRCLCTYYISGRIARDDMFIRNASQIAKLKADIIAPAEVVEVNSGIKAVTLANGDSIHYDRLLIASGSSPVIPDIEGISGEGIFTLRTLADAERIAVKMTGVTSAVILGDGLVSISAAMALNSKGLRVSVVGIAPHIMATFLDEAAAKILQTKMSSLGINLYLGRSFSEIRRNAAGMISGVTLTSGEHIDAGMVIVATGVKPNTGFLKNTGVKTGIGIHVNEHMETGVHGIFAAGDAAQCYDFVRKAPTWNPLWTNAVEQGCYAAWNMAGISRPYPGATNMNSLNLAGIPVICVGAANVGDPSYEAHIITHNGTLYEKLVFRGSCLAGFILLGRTEKAGVLTALVARQNLSPTQKTKLLTGNFSYPKVAEITG